MLRIDRDAKKFMPLETPTLAEASITERYDLQEFICNSPDAFFSEIGQALFLVGKEIEPSKSVQDRIDLLAIDKEGTGVVIELKRGNHKLHMMQAISYAGMIAQWSPDDFLQLLSEDRQELLADFLEVAIEEINRKQKIILIAESYDFALLVGAEWLSEQHGADITCCRISLAKDTQTGKEYFACSNLFPTPELANQAAPRGRRSVGPTNGTWVDWETALAAIENAALVSYYRRELAENRESYLPKRYLHYRDNGKRRWTITAGKSDAYAWQEGRFADDIGFWEGRLGDGNDVKTVKRGLCLRFFLSSENDFRIFHEAVTKELQATKWCEKTSEEVEAAEYGEE